VAAVLAQVNGDPIGSAQVLPAAPGVTGIGFLSPTGLAHMAMVIDIHARWPWQGSMELNGILMDRPRTAAAMPSA